MSWWDSETPNWSSRDARRALDVLEHAYDERPAIETIARAAGVTWGGGPPSAATARQMWRWVLDAAARARLVYNVLTTALADSSVVVFHRLLRTLLGTGELETAAVGELQAVTDVGTGLQDSRDMEAVLADGRRRTALLEVNGIPLGTGFLIGADMILTAAHVIGLACPPPQGTQVTAVFDLLGGSGAPAQAGVRVRAIEWIAGSPPTAAEVDGRYQQWNAQATHLDYAVYRLERAIGHEPVAGDRTAQPRGSYVVDDIVYDFTRAGDLTIHQHPLVGPQKMTTVRGAYSVSPARTRVRYGGNTLPGSSGSACVDARGRLVALHHFSTPAQNQGVPIFAIAADLIAKNKRALLDSRPPPTGRSAFSALTFGPKPFVNRENLREMVRGMFGQSGRVLVIQGSSRVGKSYSYQLLSHLATQWQHSPELQALAVRGVLAHKLDLDEYASLPTEGLRQRLIDAVVTMLGLVPPGWDTHAQAARTFVNLTSWLPKQLRDQGVLHWLFIDNVDRFALDRDGMKDLLVGLANLIEEDYSIPLRIVLVVGEKGPQLQSELATWALVDSLTSLQRDEAERWLRDSLAARGASVDATKVQTCVAQLHPGIPAPSPLTLAVKLAQALDDLAKGKL